MISFFGQNVGYLFVFSRINHELNRLSLTGKHKVEHEAFDDDGAVTKHHLVCSLCHFAKLGEEETTADNTYVYQYQHLSERQILVFVHACGDDVRPARTSVVQEHHGQRCAGKTTSNDHRHEVLSLAQHFDEVTMAVQRHQVLRYLQHEV